MAVIDPRLPAPGGPVAENDWFTQQGPPGMAPGGYQPPGAPILGGQPRTYQEAQAAFHQLFPGETLTPQMLKEHEAQLNALGFQLRPNAAGVVGKIQWGNEPIVDVIQGAGSGLNRKQWLPPQDGGAAGGPLAALQSSPGYQFRLAEGAKALERSAAARGTLLTGGTLKGLARFGQDYASNEYQNRYNQLAGLAGIGANAAANQGSANAQYANQAGNQITGIGNAQAAGTIGGANAINQGISGAADTALQGYALSQFGGGGGWGGGGYPGYPGTPPYFPLQGTQGRPLAPGNAYLSQFSGWAT